MLRTVLRSTEKIPNKRPSDLTSSLLRRAMITVRHINICISIEWRTAGKALSYWKAFFVLRAMFWQEVKLLRREGRRES